MNSSENRVSYPYYEIDAVTDLREMLANWQGKFNDRIAFRYSNDGQTIIEVTYETFINDVEALGTVFIDLGYQGKKIALIGDNSYQWVLTYLAAVNSGCIIVPMDRDLGSDELRYILDNCGAGILVHTSKYAKTIDALQVDLPLLEVRYHMETEDSEIVSLLKKGYELLTQGNTKFREVAIDNKACTAILYTSGTTGLAKGVMLSHFNLARDTVSTLGNIELTERSFCVLPLHHSFSMTANIFCSLHFGSTVCINQTLKDLSRDFILLKPTHVFLVPMLVEALYKRVWLAMRKAGREEWMRSVIDHSNGLLALGVDLRRLIFKQVLDNFGGSLRMIVSGGAALDPNYIKGYADFGIDLLEGYGITECTPVVAVNRNHSSRAGYVGPAVHNGCELRIVDPDENGEGEVAVRGDIVMLGYYNNPEATAATFDGDWFLTGDIGRIDDDFLKITGRKKNLIILANGKNIYPEELELKLMALPAVQETLVYGQNGIIVAEVFPNVDYVQENNFDIYAIRAELQRGIDGINNALPRHKWIADLRIREIAFEKTGSGKIKRQQRSIR